MRPLFTASPPQVGFSPGHKDLLVTTKSANPIDVFAVGPDGRLSAKAVSDKSNGDVPFSFVFDRNGHLLMTEAAKSGVTSYALQNDGKLKVITPSVESGQQVLCWIARAGQFFYGTNPGSSTISLYTVDGAGKVTIGGRNGVIATAGGEAAAKEVAAAAKQAAAGNKAPGAGPIDLAATADAKLLYVRTPWPGPSRASGWATAARSSSSPPSPRACPSSAAGPAWKASSSGDTRPRPTWSAESGR